MGNLHLVTGYAGQPHVAAADQGSLFEALIRSGEFVMEAGANFAASIVTNNQIRVNDGEMMMQGRHVKLAPGSSVDLTIENGAQGLLRKDLIVIRYSRNIENGIEECSLVVLKGTPAESNPSVPEHTTGNLNADGALQHDFPLYRVSISGLVLEGLEPLFLTEKSLFESLLRLTGGTMAGNIAMAGHKVTGLGTPSADKDAVTLGFANQKYAPAGFGLGGQSTLLSQTDDLNNVTKNGWYSWQTSSPANAPTAWGNMIVTSQTGHYEQTVCLFEPRGCAIHRTCAGDVWSAWEWVNPPMITGIEYRTTERYQGAAVYKKVDASGNILWRKDGESQWHLQSSSSYVAAATVE